MKLCKHTFWLGIGSQANAPQLILSDRLQNIARSISDPIGQKPTLFAFIGGKAKSAALQALFRVNRNRHVFSRQNTGEIHLHVDPTSVFQERPILIADGDLEGTVAISRIKNHCHDSRQLDIQRPRTESTTESFTSGIYADLLHPFVDVYCFFCEDLSGLKQVARCLAGWLKDGSTSPLPKIIYPQILIVTEAIPVGPESELQFKASFLQLLAQETEKSWVDRISSVDVVAIFPRKVMSDAARYRALKERLMGSSNAIRKEREKLQSLFSVLHFASLFDIASEQFAASAESFDYIQASRTYNPTAPDLAEHLANFLRHIDTPQKLVGFAAPAIASSFLLDYYHPNAHGRHFYPCVVRCFHYC